RAPVDVDDQEVAARVRREVDPLDLAGELRDAELRLRVRIARARVRTALDRRRRLDVVDQRVHGHAFLVEAQEREARRIRAPPERAELAATVDLLLVDPIELPVEDLLAAVSGQPPIRAGRDLPGVEVLPR